MERGLAASPRRAMPVAMAPDDTSATSRRSFTSAARSPASLAMTALEGPSPGTVMSPLPTLTTTRRTRLSVRRVSIANSEGRLRPPSEPPPSTPGEPQDGHGLGPVRPRRAIRPGEPQDGHGLGPVRPRRAIRPCEPQDGHGLGPVRPRRAIRKLRRRSRRSSVRSPARGLCPTGRGEICSSGAVLVGASIKRKEDARLVAGRGRYLDDIALPGMLHLGLIRSPHAHAHILEVHRDGASRADGVVAVWTIEDLPE